jgi:8-oxo-dGTP diphosphatase
MKTTSIAVGIILNSEKTRVFLTRRLAGSHLAGFWEFAGGKIEPRETPEQAVIRELKEEVGIVVTQLIPFSTIEHEYPEKRLILHFFLVTRFDGEPCSQEGQESTWTEISSLPNFNFPEANQSVIEGLLMQFAEIK